MEITNQNDINIDYAIDENTYNTNFKNNPTIHTSLPHIPLPPELSVTSSNKQFETDNEQNIIKNQNKKQESIKTPEPPDNHILLNSSFINDQTYSSIIRKKNFKKKKVIKIKLKKILYL